MLFETTYLLLWLVAIAQWFAVAALAKEVSLLRIRAELGATTPANRLPIGSVAPDFQLVDVRTGQRTNSSQLHGRRTVLLFLSAGCGACNKIVSGLTKLPEKELEHVLLICTGSDRGCNSYATVLAGSVPILKEGSALDETTRRFRVSGYPIAVIIDDEWRIVAYRYPQDFESVRSYLEDVDAPQDFEMQPL